MMKYYFGIFIAFFIVFTACGRPPGQPAADSRPMVDTVKIPNYDRHVAGLKGKFPDSFTILIEKPFVVIGDEPAATVRKRAQKTVQWAVDLLKKDFFTRDPEDIIDIWLFKDDSSYYRHTRKFFDTEPTTPFGFYLEDAKALVMNIGTGGGTLVHELVHPFITANFPDCPPWFNEGLASLYEQCGEIDGHIRGFTNWRLKGLQESIKAGLVPSFEMLANLNVDKFYTEDRGTNYGQARYLCYYLQEKNLLVKYYTEFIVSRKGDPTGYLTLIKILGEPDMDKFKKEWEMFVLDLKYP
jgi:hypothetical protein